MKNGLSDRKPSIVEPKEPAKPESRKESLAKPDDKVGLLIHLVT